MPVELVGMIRTNNRSEIHGPTHATAETERLGLLVAHRPGFLAPTVAARDAASGIPPIDPASQS